MIKGGTVTASGANMQITVGASTWLLPDSSNAAALFLSYTDSTVVTPAAGPGSGSRIDIIVVKQNNIANGDADSRVNVFLVAGTPSGSPVAPAVPTGAMLFATVAIPTSASTASACTFAVNNQTIVLPPIIRAADKAHLDNMAVTGFFSGTSGQLAVIYAEPVNNGIWFWSGSIWRRDASVAQVAGLVPIIPGAIANGTINANGKVTFSTVASVSIGSCFSAQYDNYLIKYTLTAKTAAVDTSFRLRLASSDSSTLYSGVVQTAQGTTASAVTNVTTQWIVDKGGSAPCSARLEVDGPFLAAATEAMGQASATATTPTASNGSHHHSAATSYDGFTLFVASGTISGTIRIYGYNDMD
jgi:hypothetical protein